MRRLLFLPLAVFLLLTACGSSATYELSGTIVLREDASTYPEFSQSCGGTGNLSFVEEGAEITVTSGSKTLYIGDLSAGRGSEYQDCEIPFSGDLVESGEYEVTITGNNGESWSTKCDGDRVTIIRNELAFLRIHIYPDHELCMATEFDS